MARILRAAAAALMPALLYGMTALQEPAKTPLIDAVRGGDVPAVKRLLESGADPNSRETLISKPDLQTRTEGGKPYKGESALMIAVWEGRIDIIKLLLDKGAEVNSGAGGFPALIRAADRGNPQIVKLLLDRGAKVNLRNQYGSTALDFAANNGHTKVAELLLRRGANVNGGTSQTPLWHAAYNGNSEVVKLLIKRGADVNLRRLNGMSPLEAAEIQGHTEIASIIRSAGGKGRSQAAIRKEIEQYTRQWEAERKRAAEQSSRDSVLTEEDREVIEAALLDLLAYKGKDLYIHSDKGVYVALIDTTARGPGMITDGQMNGDLDEMQANEITLEMREHLNLRNLKQVSVATFKSANQGIRVVTEKQARPGIFDDGDPKMKAWAQVFLPGYTKAHDKAALRFWLGPTPHGATGTYLLIKQDGKWRVKWRKFSFYV